MNDYKELIELLAHPADGRDNADIMISAADAIEQLVKERDDEREAADEWQHRYVELATKCSQLEKERDAAVKDMNTLCSTFADICSFCKNDSRNDGDVCVKCKGTDWLEFWEWRGVQEDNDEID